MHQIRISSTPWEWLFNKDFKLIIIFSYYFLINAADSCECSVPNPLIPEGYNKHLTPLEQEKKPTMVYLNLDIMDIDQIEEEKMEYSLQFYVNEYWRDLRLNLTFLDKLQQVPSSWVPDIWTPDIIFENSKGGWIYPLSIPNIVVQVHSHRYLHRFTRYNMKISCAMFLRTYPMDTQNCFLSISSLANDNTKMILKWLHQRKEGNLGIKDLTWSKIQPLKYYLANVTPGSRSYHWSGGTFTALYANFTFVRHLSSHIFNVYIPSGLVVVLSFLSFWLNVRAVPARVALGLTSLLTLSTQASQARNNLPPINYLTALDIWLFFCIVVVFLSLIEYATVYHLYGQKVRRQREDVSMSTWSKKRCRGCKIDSMAEGRFRTSANKKNLPQQEEHVGVEFDENLQTLDKACRFIFPFSFIVFCTLYWVCYLHVLL
ncbi:glycine receptor subunit alpha-1-like isoform X1 [Stegodyphus dumicola]|uniref:glycine receptor subunit alpha-1-like isoform X1 n=1 Tax=Stegodyphus dumicola TaxID=202533 RepID=UPI0015AC77F8|nr:glycine receptor subunit alpha-1-like isoform X1 [Stegodyphus dumicola]